VPALEAFARREKIPVIQFRKGQRKDDVAAEQRKKFTPTAFILAPFRDERIPERKPLARVKRLC